MLLHQVAHQLEARGNALLSGLLVQTPLMALL